MPCGLNSSSPYRYRNNGATRKQVEKWLDKMGYDTQDAKAIHATFSRTINARSLAAFKRWFNKSTSAGVITTKDRKLVAERAAVRAMNKLHAEALELDKAHTTRYERYRQVLELMRKPPLELTAQTTQVGMSFDEFMEAVNIPDWVQVAAHHADHEQAATREKHGREVPFYQVEPDDAWKEKAVEELR